MFAPFPHLLLRAIASGSLLLLGGTVLGGSIMSPAQAQSPSPSNASANHKVRRVKFTPPPMKFNRGAPGNRGHNASRDGGYCMSSEDVDSPRLVTLVPTYQQQQTGSNGKAVKTEYVASLSNSPQPVLWAYVPVDQTADEAMLEFVLQNEAGEEIYHTEVAVPETSGLLRIAPEDMPTLEENQPYQWFLVYYITCSPGAEPEIDYDEGMLRYQAVTPETTQSSEAETLGSAALTGVQWNPQLELAAEAAAAGYWHEALDQVAQLRQANPTAEVNEAWRSLLTDVGLAWLIEAPFALSSTNPSATNSSPAN